MAAFADNSSSQACWDRYLYAKQGSYEGKSVYEYSKRH